MRESCHKKEQRWQEMTCSRNRQIEGKRAVKEEDAGEMGANSVVRGTRNKSKPRVIQTEVEAWRRGEDAQKNICFAKVQTGSMSMPRALLYSFPL